MDYRFFSILLSVALPVSAAAAPDLPVRWQGTTEIATGPGEKGPWQQNDSRYHYVDDPTVSMDERGNAAVSWVDQTRKDVFFQSGGKTQDAGPLNVSRSPDTFSWLPRMVRAPDSPQRIYTLWQEIVFTGGSHGGEMMFAYSNDNGASFSEPINLSRSVGGDGKGRINAQVWHNGSYDLAASGKGVLYAAWTEYDGPLWFSRSTDGGKHFSRAQRIAGGTNARPARAPSLALGKDNTVYLAWTNGEDEDADIHLARSLDGGLSFDEPQIVAPAKGYADAPRLAVTPDGVLHLVYAQSQGGPFDRFRIMYTQAGNARSFGAPRDISSPLPNGAESAAYPSFDTDERGRLYVVYELYRDHRKRPRGLGISVSLDGGKHFTQPALVAHSEGEGTNGSHQGLLMKKLAVSGEGKIAIVNSSLQEGRQSRVWLIYAEVAEGR